MTIEALRHMAADICTAHDNARHPVWRTPLVVTAGADERFSILPEIAAPNHVLPADLLTNSRTVIVFFVPFTAAIADGNVPTKFPSADWARAKTATNTLLQHIGAAFQKHLEKSGYASFVTPPTYNWDKKSLMAQWSHKHVGYIAGLGRFGLNAQLITPSGCAGRMGSMVTAADLGDHPLVREHELCLARKGQDCRECMRSCPVGAVTPHGIDRYKCKQRLDIVRKRFAGKDASHTDGDVCAKCVAGMPCSLTAPGRMTA